MPFFKPGRVSAIVGGQFGSEAKGLAAAYMGLNHVVLDREGAISVSNAGAQAGHTTVLADGSKFVCYHLPTVGVLNDDFQIYLGPGSIINPGLLFDEIQNVAAVTGESSAALCARITVNPFAAVIQAQDIQSEKEDSGTLRIASTAKGVGAALANKIMRRPLSVVQDHEDLFNYHALQVDVLDLPRCLEYGAIGSLEIPQGTGLSLNNSRFYPYCTSRDCWVGQGLTDCGLHPHYLGDTLMVVRTFPIRVGNTEHGISGNFYGDGAEIQWSDLPGVEPERTTVTKRIRRIARWSGKQYLDSIRLNRPNWVMLTFTNYCTAKELLDIHNSMFEMERQAGHFVPNRLFSWGPRVDQVTSSLRWAYEHCREG